VAAHRSHFTPDHPGYVWMSVFAPGREEVLPGWKLDFANITRGYPRAIAGELNDDGFRFILRSEEITLIADEGVAGVYEAPTIPNGPPAQLLDEAKAYPGIKETAMVRRRGLQPSKILSHSAIHAVHRMPAEHLP